MGVMQHLVPIDRLSHPRRRSLAWFVLLLGFATLHGCKPRVQNVAHYAGNGMMKGDPPMCFQYQGVVRPTTYANNIVMYVNNTCSYHVDCQVYDDVTKLTRPIAAGPFSAAPILLAANVKVSSVTLKLECTWKE
jgi:hypothetical protein